MNDRPSSAAIDPVPIEVQALPVEPHEGVASVGISSRADAALLLTDSLAMTLARVGLPAVASSLLMTLFSSVDAYWVGTRIGADGLAAVSTSLFWIWMIISLAEMVGVGLTAVAARRHGEGREREASRLAGDSLVFSLVLVVIFAAAGLAWLDTLFSVMHTPSDVTTLGRTYLS